MDLKDKWRNILVAKGEKEKPSARKKQKINGETNGAHHKENGQEHESRDPANGETNVVALADVVASSMPSEWEGERDVMPGGTSGARGGPKKDVKSLSFDEKIFAAIISLKDNQANASAIFEWMRNRYQSCDVYTLSEVEAKLKSMCNDTKILQETSTSSYSTHIWHRLLKQEERPKTKKSKAQSQIPVMQGMSADDCAELAAKAVAEALAAAEQADNAMAEAAALERQAKERKKEEEEKVRNKPFKKR